MALSTDLISQFVKVTKDETKDNKGSTVYGEVVKYNNKDYVKIDGSDLLTPISSSSIAVDDGERVSILIKDHNATVTGNITSPAGTDKSVQNVSQKVTELYSVVAEKATFEQLEAEKARIDDLVADNVTIKEQLTADSADIRDLKAKEVTISTICKTIDYLSHQKVGALITFERKKSLDEIINKAIPINADITQEILTTIFTPGTACHDGGVIIRNNKIACAGAYFPLSDNYDIPTFLGTRHRAAIGVSEVYDAITIVVSEETGNISITISGNISLELTTERVATLLDSYLGAD